MTAPGDRPTPGGARLQLRSVSKSFGSTIALHDLDLDLEPGSFTAVLGPSGCGKSTLLSVVAGLTAPDRGDVLLDGVSLRGVAPERRPVGLVFQKPLLLPHLSVEANVGFGLRMRRLPRREIRASVSQMLDRLELGGLGDRRVGELSGGQEQRVAMARALVLSPRVLLLDEPFSALDAELRVRMRTLVRRLADESGVTTLFVTHDQGEAVEVADDIALVLSGRLVAHGSPETFYARPASLDAARFFGGVNEIAGTVTHGRFTATGDPAATVAAPDAPDGRAVLVVRPERLGWSAPSAGLTLQARVDAVHFAGTHLLVRLTAAAGDLALVAPVGTVVVPGAHLTVSAPAEACTVFPVSPAG